MRIFFNRETRPIKTGYKNEQDKVIAYPFTDEHTKKLYMIIYQILKNIMAKRLKYPARCDNRVCSRGCFCIMLAVTYYELNLRVKTIRDHIDSTILAYKEERFEDMFYAEMYNHETIIDILSIIHTVVNLVSDSTLSNNYLWQPFMDEFIQMVHVGDNAKHPETFTTHMKEYYFFHQHSKENVTVYGLRRMHFRKVFKFTERINWKVYDYILNFYPYFVKTEDGCSDVPHCFLMTGVCCTACNRYYFGKEVRDSTGKLINKIAIPDDILEAKLKSMCFTERQHMEKPIEQTPSSSDSSLLLPLCTTGQEAE